MTGLLILAIATACGAAVRSTWSPCGLSMLSTITPLTERARGHRYGLTVAWFALGALAGGAALGVMAAVLALLVHVVGLSATAALATGAVFAVVGLAADLHVAGVRLPTHPRQVNETWLGRYRRWIYAAGFGVQIGSGLATYVMTAAVYLTIVLAALTGSPIAALGIGMLFGAVRGLAVLAGRRGDDARGDPRAACPPCTRRNPRRAISPLRCRAQWPWAQPGGRSARRCPPWSPASRGFGYVTFEIASAGRTARQPPGLPGAVRRCPSTERRPASTGKIRCLPDRSSARSRRSA